MYVAAALSTLVVLVLLLVGAYWAASTRKRLSMRQRDASRLARQLRWHRGEEPMPFTWYDTYREHWELVRDFDRMTQPPPNGLGFVVAFPPEQTPLGKRVTYTTPVAAGGYVAGAAAVHSHRGLTPT